MFIAAGISSNPLTFCLAGHFGFFSFVQMLPVYCLIGNLAFSSKLKTMLLDGGLFLDCRFLVFFCKVRIVAVQPWNFFLIRDVVCFDYSSRLRSAYFDSLIVRIICEFVQAPVGEVQTELHWIRIQELQDCCSLLFRYSSWFSRILFPLKDPQSELIELLDYFLDFWPVKV